MPLTGARLVRSQEAGWSPLYWQAHWLSLFISVKKLIFDHDNTFERARRYVPVYMWMVGFMISMVTLLKGLKHVGLDLNTRNGLRVFADATVIHAVIGLVVAAIGALRSWQN